MLAGYNLAVAMVSYSKENYGNFPVKVNITIINAVAIYYGPLIQLDKGDHIQHAGYSA